MRYRIKIVTFETGKKKYYPEKKGLLFWGGIDWEGDVGWLESYDYPNRETALEKIDLNFKGNCKKQTIEFEYITKGVADY